MMLMCIDNYFTLFNKTSNFGLKYKIKGVIYGLRLLRNILKPQNLIDLP